MRPEHLFLQFRKTLKEPPKGCGQIYATRQWQMWPIGDGRGKRMQRGALTLSALLALCACVVGTPAAADYRITRDHGGLVDVYKAKYAKIRDRGERVIIDGICNSACTLVLGIVPLNRVCVTPNASLGFHQAYYDTAYTMGVKITSLAGTADLMSYYPTPVKNWIKRQGGLTTTMKKVRNGPDLWAMIDPCPEEF